MRTDAAQIYYGTPPKTRLGLKRHLECGHGRGRAIIARDLIDAWCWECETRVRMVRIPRMRKRDTSG